MTTYTRDISEVKSYIKRTFHDFKYHLLALNLVGFTPERPNSGFHLWQHMESFSGSHEARSVIESEFHVEGYSAPELLLLRMPDNATAADIRDAIDALNASDFGEQTSGGIVTRYADIESDFGDDKRFISSSTLTLGRPYSERDRLLLLDVRP